MEKFRCSRPKLAVRLATEGIMPCGKEPNPWNPHVDFLLYNLDLKTANIIVDYFNEIGKKVPAVVTQIIGEGGTESC